MNESNLKTDRDKSLEEKIKYFRQKALKKRKQLDKEQLGKPVSFWIKEDRLLKEIGKEFTIILRTKGCNWALGDTGGCSMCGYVQDACIESITPDQIKNQFNYALNKKMDEIEKEEANYVIKIFNSGSFFDDNEISEDLRMYIYEKMAQISKFKEVVVESRVEYITPEKLAKMQDILNKKYCEIGIGLETINDYIRNNYINKGFTFNDFKNALKLCQEHDIGVKAYLLFKPPFINEQGAIDDCVDSIKTLLNLNVKTISINPVNIQKGSLVEYLWFQKRYRPPWYYSLFKSIKKAINQEDLMKVRILSAPSGAGTKRGIHNCLRRECNENMKEKLRNFVLSQRLNKLKQIKFECDCKQKYLLQKNYN